MQTTVTKRGQTIIPPDIRERYEIAEGETLVWLEDAGSIEIIPAPSDPVRALRGSAEGEGLTRALLTERREDRNRE